MVCLTELLSRFRFIADALSLSSHSLSHVKVLSREKEVSG